MPINGDRQCRKNDFVWSICVGVQTHGSFRPADNKWAININIYKIVIHVSFYALLVASSSSPVDGHLTLRCSGLFFPLAAMRWLTPKAAKFEDLRSCLGVRTFAL